MAPAMRPASSCSAPSSVEMDCAVAWVKVSGRAPYRSWLASSVAASWSKSPVIVVCPLIAPLMTGAEMTGGSYYYLDLTALGRQEEWEEPKGRSESARIGTPDFAS